MTTKVFENLFPICLLFFEQIDENLSRLMFSKLITLLKHEKHIVRHFVSLFSKKDACLLVRDNPVHSFTCKDVGSAVNVLVFERIVNKGLDKLNKATEDLPVQAKRKRELT